MENLKIPFISRMGPCEDLLANPGFPQYVVDSGIVFAFDTMTMSYFREDTAINHFPSAIRFEIKMDVEQFDYQVRVRGYLEPELVAIKGIKNTLSRHTSCWSKTEHIYSWTKEDTLRTMMYSIFKQFNRNYYYGDNSFVSFPVELLMILEKRVDGDDYALEASFYTDDLVPVIKDENWSKRAEKYALSL